jgi:hypothetical protein
VLLTDPLNCSVDSLSEQFLSSAVDAAHKAGDVSSFSFQLSLSLSSIAIDSLSISFFSGYSKRILPDQTRWTQRIGLYFPILFYIFLNPIFFSCSILFNIIEIGVNFTYCHWFLRLWFLSHFSNLLLNKLT